MGSCLSRDAEPAGPAGAAQQPPGAKRPDSRKPPSTAAPAAAAQAASSSRGALSKKPSGTSGASAASPSDVHISAIRGGTSSSASAAGAGSARTNGQASTSASHASPFQSPRKAVRVIAEGEHPPDIRAAGGSSGGSFTKKGILKKKPGDGDKQEVAGSPLGELLSGGGEGAAWGARWWCARSKLVHSSPNTRFFLHTRHLLVTLCSGVDVHHHIAGAAKARAQAPEEERKPEEDDLLLEGGQSGAAKGEADDETAGPRRARSMPARTQRPAWACRPDYGDGDSGAGSSTGGEEDAAMGGTAQRGGGSGGEGQQPPAGQEERQQEDPGAQGAGPAASGGSRGGRAPPKANRSFNNSTLVRQPSRFCREALFSSHHPDHDGDGDEDGGQYKVQTSSRSCSAAGTLSPLDGQGLRQLGRSGGAGGRGGQLRTAKSMGAAHAGGSSLDRENSVGSSEGDGSETASQDGDAEGDAAHGHGDEGDEPLDGAGGPAGGGDGDGDGDDDDGPQQQRAHSHSSPRTKEGAPVGPAQIMPPPALLPAPPPRRRNRPRRSATERSLHQKVLLTAQHQQMLSNATQFGWPGM